MNDVKVQQKRLANEIFPIVPGKKSDVDSCGVEQVSQVQGRVPPMVGQRMPGADRFTTMPEELLHHILARFAESGPRGTSITRLKTIGACNKSMYQVVNTVLRTSSALPVHSESLCNARADFAVMKQRVASGRERQQYDKRARANGDALCSLAQRSYDDAQKNSSAFDYAAMETMLKSCSDLQFELSDSPVFEYVVNSIRKHDKPLVLGLVWETGTTQGENDSSLAGFKKFCDWEEGCRHEVSLQIASQTEFSSAAKCSFVRSVYDNRHIKGVHFYHHSSGNNMLEVITGTPPSFSLRELSLSGIANGSIQRKWRHAIRSMSHLENFVFDGNRCDDASLKRIARALTTASGTLKSVNLDGNRLTDTGAVELLTILSEADALQTLSVCDNQLSVEGMDALQDTADAINARRKEDPQHSGAQLKIIVSNKPIRQVM